MRPVDLIVYDFDGTLIDSKQDIADSVNLALADLGLRALPRKLLYSYIGRGVDALIRSALAGTGYNNLVRAVECFRHHYSKHLLDHTNIFPNGRETVQFFSNKKQAIFSNKPRLYIQKILEALDFQELFVEVLGGDSVAEKKPHPQGLLQLMKSLNATPERVVMVGDSPLDIQSGKSAGAHTCAVTHGLTEPSILKENNPNWMIHNLAELKEILC